MYHPDMALSGLETVAVGAERAWQVRVPGALFRFGIGPPVGAGRDAGRADRAAADGGWRAVTATQPHRARVASVAQAPPAPVEGCDGLATGSDRLALVVWTADCVPLLLAGGPAVAAVHAGWRGAAAGVVPAALELLRDTFGVHPRELWAWLGPAVCGRHYPVGAEVVAALEATGVEPSRWRRGCRVDLRRLVALQLEAGGVERRRIGVVAACTVEDPALASYRRDGAAAGRQWSLAARSRPLS